MDDEESVLARGSTSFGSSPLNSCAYARPTDVQTVERGPGRLNLRISTQLNAEILLKGVDGVDFGVIMSRALA